MRSQKHTSQTQHGREAKRAQFAAPPGRTKNKKYVPLMILGVIGIGAYLMGSSWKDEPESGSVVVASTALPKSSTATSAPGADISIPISEVSSGRGKFYRYTSANNTSVRFFVIKSSDGVYRAALDTCDVCYQAKKGYYQDEDDMVCRKCGRKFPSAMVNEVSGGCNPVGVPRTIQGDKLVIQASALEAGAIYF